ncbi:glycoside hydrolase family 71/99-like protein [Pedosphaera parvula]|uniref:Glycoside hydrolase family 42 N-terminal domain-containing protein n=1 Tax=Pedosphaera parvula (strain Ellin514) TaxID=320771 RepID=B9XQT6_PEDPL|nr:glycoside hydrolase family 71/99-like protein [Pedosphaera parvula]EEF57793.1 hypothetical protein Cflav_PD0893 [Pedosphaera parvula Ellin514]
MSSPLSLFRICSANVATLLLILFALPAQADTIDSSTLNNKFLLGYQGWHACAGDGSALNRYVHWTGDDTIPNPGTVKHPIWPELSEFPPEELFPTDGIVLGNGQPAMVYSCYVSNTVARHFKWMQDYGIDGVLVQRFTKDVYQGADWGALKTTNLVNVRAAAEAYGRVFCVEYDISNDDPSQVISHLQNDWAYLTGTLGLTNSNRYLKHKGKPVVEIWGLGFVGVNIPPTDAQTIINNFRAAGCTVVGGVPQAWRALAGDSQTNAAWLNVYHSFDVINPWAVGRYQTTNQVDSVAKPAYIGDLADLTPRGIDYLPVIFPGYAVASGPRNGIPRLGGRFYWRQAYDAVSVGCNMAFGAMFDEIDEGTATYKLAPTMSTTPAVASMFALDVDGEAIPSDWYLRVGGEITKALRKEVPLNEPLPIAPNAEIKLLSPNGGEVWNAGDLALVNWNGSGSLTNVRIDLSTDGAATWSCLAYGVTNSGSALVLVPNTPSTNCWLRVAGLSGTPATWSATHFTIQTQPSFRPTHLQPLWSLAPGSRSYVTTDVSSTPNQRSLAYNSLSNQVIVVSRTGATTGLTVNVLDATTGQYLYQLNTTGITGGSIILLSVAVSDDGSVYAGNMSTSGGGVATYKLYRWPNSGSAAIPTTIFSGEPAGRTDSVRWGDTLAVQGAGTNTQIMIDAYGTNVCAIFTPVNSSLTSWISRSGPQDYFPGSIGRSLQFGPTNTFWQKRKADRLEKSGFSITGSLGTSNLVAYTFLPGSTGPVGIDFTRNLLGAINYCGNTNGPDTLDLYDISNINSPVLLARVNFPVNQKPNANFVGQIVFGGGKVFAIDGNNGIVAFSIVDALPPTAIRFTFCSLNGSGALQLSATGDPAPGYDLEISSNCVNWIPFATMTNFTGSIQFTDSAPALIPQRFYRLRAPK